MRKNVMFIVAIVFIFNAAVIGSLGASQTSGQNPAVVKSIGYLKLETGVEVTVRIEGEFLYSPLTLSHPTRLVIDIAPAQKIAAQPFYEVNIFSLTSIRTGQFAPSIARVIFDFSDALPPYEIQKNESGLTVKFSRDEKKNEQAVVPQVEQKAVKEVKEIKEETRAEIPRQEEQEIEETEEKGIYNTSLGFMVGTYLSPSTDFREVYGSETSMQFGLNLTRTLLRYKRFQFDVSFEGRIFSKNGASTIDLVPSKFSMTPISLAGRFLYQTKYVIPFIGIGGDWTSYKEESSLAGISGSASGWHYQVGVYIVIPKIEYVRLKLYYKFTEVTATENELSVKIGGNEYGIGVSFGFNFFKKGVLSF